MKATKFKKAISYFALASVFTMAGCQKDELLEEQTTSPAVDKEVQPASNKIEGQYIVVFKNNDGNATEIINNLTSSHLVDKTGIRGRFEGKIKGFHGRLSKEQFQSLRNNPEVASIEQDQIIALGKTNSTTTTTKPTAVKPLSGTLSTTMTIKAGESVPAGVDLVGFGDGTGKTAWVIDSGIDLKHPDLNVDATRSLSFISGVSSVQDVYGHGTMVAGIIAAKNNGVGIVGVAANATVVALRVLDDAGNGSLSNLIKAVNHVSANGKAGDVVNISISANASATLDNSIKTLAAKGIFISIAAGNSNVDCSNNSPQRVNATNVYTVSGMGIDKQFYGVSNFGLPVDRCAPGIRVQTTAKGGGYTQGTGTSFAAPHVAGLLLLKGNAISSAGTVIGDKDKYPDPIAHL